MSHILLNFPFNKAANNMMMDGTFVLGKYLKKVLQKIIIKFLNMQVNGLHREYVTVSNILSIPHLSLRPPLNI